MNINKTSILIFAVSIAIAVAAPAAFAQVGVGVGVGAGGHVQTPGVGVGAGAGTHTEIHAKAPAEIKAGGNGQAEARHDAISTSAVAARIEHNAQLAARVQSMLPSGSSINSAAAGFKNEGQFISALHVSHNLDIPFEDLKAKMTGSNAMSLGSAIQATKPEMSGVEAKEAAAKAEAQAKTTASAKADGSSKPKEEKPAGADKQ